MLSNFIAKSAEKILRNFILLFVGAYRTIGTTHLGGGCRFQPSCSEYALEAARLHPPLIATRLIVTRICRCRPGGSFGDDPVPPRAPLAQLVFQECK